MFQFKSAKNQELLETIEKQKEQLERYKGRLADVVHAYKSLQNEKGALENSMKALTAVAPKSSNVKKKSKPVDLSTESDNNEDDASIDEENKEQYSDDEENDSSQHTSESETADETSQIDHFKSQVHTLTISLQTMSEEKSKIVATYQAEKKKLKNEQESTIKNLEDQLSTYETKTEMLENEVLRLKERSRKMQIERDQEEATHGIMLRQIQKMLNDERIKNERLEAQLKEMKSNIQLTANEALQTEDYKQRIVQLEQELIKVGARLKIAEEEANNPSPLLLELQDEIGFLKKEHRCQLAKEQERLVDVEKRSKHAAEVEEERVRDLENRLVQISNKLGMYDGNRQKDQLSIQHLKERISQLEIENTLLLKQVDTFKGEEKEQNDMDTESLKKSLLKFHKMLKEAADRNNEAIDLSEITADFVDPENEDSSRVGEYQKLYFDSQQEVLQIKEDFEKYKTRAQNAFKNLKSGGVGGIVGGSNKEVEEMRRQAQEGRERYFQLRERCSDLEEKIAKMTEDHEKALEKEQILHKTETETLHDTHERRVCSMERDIRQQRERTVALLADKDKEIKNLKTYNTTYSREYQATSGVNFESSFRRLSSNDAEHSTDSMNQFLQKDEFANDSRLIHYVEQLARKDVLINSIRQHKKNLELQIRQLQDTNITKEEKHIRQIAELREKILEFDRQSLRVDANTEYIKNVLYRYLVTTDYTAKQKMLVAISTILHFSPDEAKKVGVKIK